MEELKLRAYSCLFGVILSPENMVGQEHGAAATLSLELELMKPRESFSEQWGDSTGCITSAAKDCGAQKVPALSLYSTRSSGLSWREKILPFLLCAG